MKKLFKFLTPFVWIILAMYGIDLSFDLMNTPSTFNVTIGFLGIILIVYLSAIKRLGTKFFKH